MTLADYSCLVLENRPCGNHLKLLRLKTIAPDSFQCQPGQFVMLDLPVSEFHFRRPFSVLDTPEPGVLDIYYKIVGKGTRLMADIEPGDHLQCLGPLGKGFVPPTDPDTALYVGGGIGIAPLYFLAKTLTQKGHCFYGVRSHAEIGLETELKAVFSENLHIATDDGSFGHGGNVCDLMSRHHDRIRMAKDAYVCGPTRMMEASVRLLLAVNPELRIQVSLEEHMPCGTGACTGCVVPRADQPLPSKVCLEGPVFEARQIQWRGGALGFSEFCEESPCPL